MGVQAVSSSYASPDGGWGWVILFAASIHQMLLPMVYGTFGIFFLEFLDVYDVKPSQLTWVGALQGCLMGFSGLLWGPLIQKFGARPASMIAVIMVAVAFFTASFTTDMTGLFLTYGALAGIGCGGLTLSGLILIQHYFHKYRSLASGIAMAGSSLGQFIWPPAGELIINTFTWRGAMVVMAGVVLQGTVASALMRPAPRKATSNHTSEDDPITPEEDPEKQFTTTENGDKTPCLEEKHHAHHSNGNSHVAAPDEVIFRQQGDQVVKPPAGSLDFVKNPMFIVFLVGMFFVLVGHMGPISFLPLKCVHEGLSKSSAALVASMVGAGSCVGRVLAGVLGDKLHSQRFILLASTSLVAGLASGLVAICKEPILMGVLALIFGLASGGYITFQMPVIVDIIGVDNLGLGAAFSMVVLGLSHLILFTVSGHLLDLTGNPSYAFLVLGCLQFTGGLVFCLLPVFNRREMRRKSKRLTS